MSKSRVTKKCEPKKSNLRSNIPKPVPKKIFEIGMWYPDMKSSKHELHADGFDIIEGDTNFFCYGKDGNKEFVAYFTHVSYIMVKDPIPKETISISDVELPKDWGKIV